MTKYLLAILILGSFSSYATDLEKYECDISSNEYTKVYFEINHSDNWAQFNYIDNDGNIGPGAIATAGLDGEDTSLALGYITSTTAMGNNVKELLFIFEKLGSYAYLNLYSPYTQGAVEVGKCSRIN